MPFFAPVTSVASASRPRPISAWSKRSASASQRRSAACGSTTRSARWSRATGVPGATTPRRRQPRRPIRSSSHGGAAAVASAASSSSSAAQSAAGMTTRPDASRRGIGTGKSAPSPRSRASAGASSAIVGPLPGAQRATSATCCACSWNDPSSITASSRPRARSWTVSVDRRHERRPRCGEVELDERQRESRLDARAALADVVDDEADRGPEQQPIADRPRLQDDRAGERDLPRRVGAAGAADGERRGGAVGEQVAQRRQHGRHRVGVVVDEPLPIRAHGGERVLQERADRDRRDAGRRRDAEDEPERVGGGAEAREDFVGDVGEDGRADLGDRVGARQVERSVRMAGDGDAVGGEQERRLSRAVEREPGAQRRDVQRRRPGDVDQCGAAGIGADDERELERRQRGRAAVAEVERTEHRFAAQYDAGVRRAFDRHRRRDAHQSGGAGRRGHCDRELQRAERERHLAGGRRAAEQRGELRQPRVARRLLLQHLAEPARERDDAVARELRERQRRDRAAVAEADQRRERGERAARQRRRLRAREAEDEVEHRRLERRQVGDAERDVARRRRARHLQPAQGERELGRRTARAGRHRECERDAAEARLPGRRPARRRS